MEEASEEIFKQATGKDQASSVDILDACESVLNGGANILKSAFLPKNNEEVRRKREQISTTRNFPTMLSNYAFFLNKFLMRVEARMAS